MTLLHPFLSVSALSDASNNVRDSYHNFYWDNVH